MKIKVLSTLFLFTSTISFSQNLMEEIFSANKPDFIFRILYEREGESELYRKKPYKELKEIIPGQIDFKSSGEHILKIFNKDEITKIIIKSLNTPEPQMASNGTIVRIIMSEESLNESTGEKSGFAIINYSDEKYCHLLLTNENTGYTYEYIIILGF